MSVRATVDGVSVAPATLWPGGSARMVAVPGGALAVETAGAGPPLLLLHGWTLDRRMWLPQLPLASDFRLVGIDRRGFGQSTAPPDLAAEPADVLRVADALGLGRFHLLGMSQGGRVALAVAAAAPQRLLSLTLQCTALDGIDGDDEDVPVEAMVAAARRADLVAMRALWISHPLMRLANPAGAALVAEMLAAYDGRDLLAQGCKLPVASDMIDGWRFPVTAIVGSEDTDQRRANARALAAAGAGKVELSACGHLCNFDSPERFNAEVRARISVGAACPV